MVFTLRDKLKNKGKAPADRARNLVATDMAFALGFFRQMAEKKSTLDDIAAAPSGSQPPGREFWDVKFSFFDPEKSEAASHIFSLTVDVSDVMPFIAEPPGPARRQR
jgi:hypothetical protein